MQTFELVPRGPFSLAASRRFLEGFAPAGYDGDEARSAHLHLTFAVEGTWEPVGVCVRERDGTVVGEVAGQADLAAVRTQVRRILSLDVDGSGFAAVGDRDPVIARLQRRYPGLRPVGFCSPYEAAAWTLIGRRIRIVQAAGIKQRMAEQLGDPVRLHGQTLHAFPGPARLRSLDAFSGLSGRKVDYLGSLAEATLRGRLDAQRLRAQPRPEALSDLRRLPGVGPFSAELVLLRGAGDPDHVPLHERRLRTAVRRAYDLAADPGDDQLRDIAEGWRPYRTWATLLLRADLEEQTGEIAGRRPRAAG